MTSIIDVLLPYQKAFFLAKQTRKVWISSRQIGKSFTIAACLVYKALEKQGNLSLCISVNSRSAAEIVKKCQQFAEAVKALSKGKISYSSSFDGIKFSNGSRILSLPSTADSLRGFTAACVAIDESAFVYKLEDVLQAIGPTLSRDQNAQLLLTSTPAGKNGEFYKLWEKAQNDKAWYTQTTTIEDAMNDGLEVDLAGLHSLCPDPQAFAQEYMCTFASEYNAMLDPALLESYDALPQGTFGHWLGIDVGRTHDKTAIVQATGLDGTMYVEEITVLDKVEYSKQLDSVASLENSRHFTGGYVDAGGIGSMLAEYVNKQVSPRIKPLSFTGANKTPMYEALRDLVFRQKVKFAKHLIERVKQDIQQVSRVVTASGEVRYQASRSELGHADMTSALVLCTEAFKKMPISQELPVSMPATSRLGAWRARI